MSEELPKGWVKTKLGEVCLPVETLQPGDTPDAEFTYFDIGGIDNENNRIAETKIVTGRNAPSRARQAVRKDDILFSTVRTYLRKIARVERDYPNPVASTGFTIIRAAEGVYSLFLFYQVLSEDFLQPLHQLQTGTSYPAVRDRDVLSQRILLPPTREQERIVTKLNSALLAVERANTAARRARERLQRYKAAVLQAAVSGELTRYWREAQLKNNKAKSETGETLLQRLLVARRDHWEEAELQRLLAAGKVPKDDKWKSRYPEPAKINTENLPKLPRQWTWASLEQITLADRPICYGILMPKQHVPNGIPYVRVKDMKREVLNVGELKRTSPKIAAAYARASLRKGDLVLAIRGTYGRIAVVPEELDGGNITQDTARLAINPLTHASHVLWAVRSELIQSYFKRVARGVAVKGVNIADVKLTPVPLPHLIEQIEIERQVERRLKAADRLMVKIDRQLERARATRETLLREARVGRLVPQNPNDEPAAVLLERIRAAHEADAKKQKGKRMSKPITAKKGTTRRPLHTVLKENGGPMTPEELFQAAGYTQESADNFFAELRDLTENPSKVVEERRVSGQILLRAVR